jgi:hypothetical protein
VGEKRFTQRKPNGSGWQWKDLRKGQRSVLYRLPEVNEAIKEGRTIVVVEGEKDVDNCGPSTLPLRVIRTARQNHRNNQNGPPSTAPN